MRPLPDRVPGASGTELKLAVGCELSRYEMVARPGGGCLRSEPNLGAATWQGAFGGPAGGLSKTEPPQQEKGAPQGAPSNKWV